jgi:hypothetical protein
MAAFDLTLPFLGNRNYVQGATLFDGLMGPYPDATEISFKIGQMIVSDRIRVVNCKCDDPDRPAANLLLKDRSGAPVRLSVYQLSSSLDPKRELYDEAAIVNAARFDVDGVAVAPIPGLSTAKVMVALNKALLLRILSPRTRGQWLFTRLDIALYPKSMERISVRYRTRSAFAAALSDVSVDGQTLGKIMFSWQEER